MSINTYSKYCICSIISVIQGSDRYNSIMSQVLSCAVMLTEHDIVCESYESVGSAKNVC